jgi:hypothetical protein
MRGRGLAVFLPLAPALAAAADGTRDRLIQNLMNAAMRNEDPGVRPMAFRAGLRVLRASRGGESAHGGKRAAE